MRSGYESFLRRQLLKPRAAPLRWSEPPAVLGTPAALVDAAAPPSPGPAPELAPAPTAAPPAAEDRTRADARPPAFPELIDETMPAILWRDSAAPAIEPAAAAAAAAAPAVNARPAPLPAPAKAAASPSRAAHTLAQLDSLIDAALAEAEQRCGLGAAVRISVARLDEIGDAWGERAISHVLRALHQRLSRLLGQVAPKAHALALGDALWVVLPQLERTSVAEALVRQLLEALTRPLLLDNQALALHGSAGLAVFPHDGTDAAGLRRAAEVAGRQARQRGRGAYQFYAREIEARAQRRLTLEARLRHAITHDELTTAYQPRAEVRSGALCGVELLPGWEPPGQALWQGPELLLLAEESGLAEALAHWCLRAACRHLRGWLADGLSVPQLSLPMLPSPFKRAGFVDTLVEQVRSQGIDAARLTLLLSPVAPLAHGGPAGPFAGFDQHQAAQRLKQCRDAGFRIAMDGAATSACSLATLRQLPLSELRLDSQLLGSDPTHAGFAAAIVTLGHGLGLRVAASGVTHDEQLDELVALGCDEFQGELLSDPLPAATWAEVMAGAGAASASAAAAARAGRNTQQHGA